MNVEFQQFTASQFFKQPSLLHNIYNKPMVPDPPHLSVPGVDGLLGALLFLYLLLDELDAHLEVLSLFHQPILVHKVLLVHLGRIVNWKHIGNRHPNNNHLHTITGMCVKETSFLNTCQFTVHNMYRYMNKLSVKF